MAAFGPEQDTTRTSLLQGIVSLGVLVALVLVFHARGASWPMAFLEGVAADVALTLLSCVVLTMLGLAAFAGLIGIAKKANRPLANMTGPPWPTS